MEIIYPDGATPLDPEGIKGLIPTHIINQAQLDEWEYVNILKAEKWAYEKKHKDIFTVSFLMSLHKKMFNDTWSWAGKFRKHQTNIGVEWHQIIIQTKLLCDDFKYHLVNNHFLADELALRFNHRLVLIHPFTNGNGRHARIMANLLAKLQGRPNFSFGLNSKLNSLTTTGKLRTTYLSALRMADQGNFSNLISFSRS